MTPRAETRSSTAATIQVMRLPSTVARRIPGSPPPTPSCVRWATARPGRPTPELAESARCARGGTGRPGPAGSRHADVTVRPRLARAGMARVASVRTARRLVRRRSGRSPGGPVVQAARCRGPRPAAGRQAEQQGPDHGPARTPGAATAEAADPQAEQPVPDRRADGADEQDVLDDEDQQRAELRPGARPAASQRRRDQQAAEPSTNSAPTRRRPKTPRATSRPVGGQAEAAPRLPAAGLPAPRLQPGRLDVHEVHHPAQTVDRARPVPALCGASPVGSRPQRVGRPS